MGKRISSGKRKDGGDSISTDSWMTTFSDLCTLLLTFFVLLFSLSSMDSQKLKIAFQNFGGSSGILSFKEYHEISRPRDIMMRGLVQLLGDKVVIGDDMRFNDSEITSQELETLGNRLQIKKISNGISLIFGDMLLFTAGSAEIMEGMKPVLDIIARFISISGYQAYVDGHTDSTPIRKGRYASNDELSIERAYSVVNYFVTVSDVPSDAIGITGYGALKPVAPNGNKKGRALNRRVEIILKSQSYF